MTGTLATSKAVKGGNRTGDEAEKNGLAAQGCMGREGSRKQFKGGRTATAQTGGGGWQGLTLV